MRTDEDIKTSIMGYIRSSGLMDEATGTLTIRSRPLGSREEDVVVSVKSNNGGQRQIAYVNVHIYVLADDVGRQYEEPTGRCRVLCRKAADILDSFFPGDGSHCTLESQRVYKADGTEFYLINNEIKYIVINE